MLPLAATVAAADARVLIETQYPFGDSTARVTLVTGAREVRLRIRIPGWADGALVDGKPAPNGTLHPIDCAAATNTTVRVELRPSVRVELGWGDMRPPTPTNAVGVSRGPLVFALHPAETREVVRVDNSTPARRGLANDYRISTRATWNYALNLSADISFVEQSSAHWMPSYAFDDSGEYPFYVRASGCRLPAWTTWNGTNITEAPPPSPIDAGSCAGAADPLRLVPFGATNIRIAVFPWFRTGVDAK